MSNYPNTSKLATAITDRTHHNLSCRHITTSNFMDLNVAKYLELVPKQEIKISHRLFTRLEPLTLPTFGDCQIHNRAFFVPYRTVFPAWNDFITDSIHRFSESGFTNHVTSVPTILNSVFISFFKSYTCSTPTGDENYDSADFVVIEASGRPVGYNFNKFGSICFKLLSSLGYGFDFNLRNTDTHISALPLLCLVKIYMDWYYPSAYIQDSMAVNVSQWFSFDNGVNEFHEVFDADSLYDCMRVIYKVNYDDDYFVNTWDNPVGPSSGSFSDISLFDVTENTSIADGAKNFVEVDELGNGTPVLRNSSNRITQLTEYSLRSLTALTDYMKRHQMAGARALDRYLARFGVTLDSDKLQRCYYLKGYNQIVQFGDVTSMASTDGEVLGGYAGKGISDSTGEITFSTDEYGMFIIISTIVPKTSFYQGQDRITMHLTRLDFYTPEFDNLGVQAVSTRELFTPLDGRQQYADNVTDYTTESFNYDDYVFGFVPRYAEYKKSVDMITGDLRLNSRNTGKEGWTLFRDIKPFKDDYTLSIKTLKHNESFTRGIDSEQYLRIFNTTDPNKQDFFNILHLFKIDSSFPGKHLYDTYEFEDEDKAQKVKTEVNGVKVN